MAFRQASKHWDASGGGHGDDLLITPLLDLFVALIPFLIISAVVSHINVVDVAISKPVLKKISTASENDFDLLMKVSDAKAEIFLKGKLQQSVDLAGGENAVEKLRLKLVEIKRSYPEEYKIRIEPVGKAKLALIMDVMDAARKLKGTDAAITRKNEKGEMIRLQYLFPNVILKGVYSS